MRRAVSGQNMILVKLSFIICWFEWTTHGIDDEMYVKLSLSDSSVLSDPTKIYKIARDSVEDHHDLSSTDLAKLAATRAALGLVHLQRIYRIPITNFSEGFLLGRNTATLSVEDLQHISLTATEHGLAEFAKIWKNVASDHENLRQTGRLNCWGQRFRKSVKCQSRYGHMSGDDDDGLSETGFEEQNPIHKQYEKLCRGKDIHLEDVHHLKCRHRPMTIGYGKWKVEEAHTSPDILMFHDVLNDREILDIQAMASDDLVPSNTVGQDGRIMTDSHRISYSTWFDIPTVLTRSIERRISDMTGLDASISEANSSSEHLQVCSYLPGGLYQPHYDILGSLVEVPKYIQYSGDRMSTFMIYLNDVDVGGATVFPLLDLRIPPRKGSAVFWQNLLPDGKPDTRSIHAGCPVMFGTKWVVNKWIHERGKISCSNRPC